MDDDEGSRLSLEYSGSQSPLPPSPVLPKGHRYFGNDATQLHSLEAHTPAGIGCDNRRSDGVTAAEPLRTHRASHDGVRQQDRPAARAVPSGTRAAPQHRTEHRRQGLESREAVSSEAKPSGHGGRDSHAARSSIRPAGSERRSSARDSSSRQRRHSPVPRRPDSNTERGATARRRGSGRIRSPSVSDPDPDSSPRNDSADRRARELPPDRQHSRPHEQRQRGRSPPSGHGRREDISVPEHARRRRRSPDDRRPASPVRHGQLSDEGMHDRHWPRSGQAADGRDDGMQPGAHRPRSPEASSDDQRQRHAPGTAVQQPTLGALPPPPRSQRADDPRLDFCSSQFDALLALYSPGLQLPNSRAAPLNFVLQCRNLLPPEDENWLPAVDRSMPSKSQLARQAQESRTGNAAAAAAKSAARESPLDTIAASIQAGPLLLLKQAYEARGAVRVVTRHARGVRGVATGTLLGFDKHMNLILRDVEETYTVLIRVCRQLPPRKPTAATFAADDAAASAVSLSTAREAAASAAEPAAEGPELPADNGVPAAGRWRWGRKQEVRRRSLRQVFVRGDNIVLVSLVSGSDPIGREGLGTNTASQKLGGVA